MSPHLREIALGALRGLCLSARAVLTPSQTSRGLLAGASRTTRCAGGNDLSHSEGR